VSKTTVSRDRSSVEEDGIGCVVMENGEIEQPLFVGLAFWTGDSQTIQNSLDLTTWKDLIVLTNTESRVRFTNAPNFPQQFYRAVSP
jgi:hypothetical protein